MPRTVQGQPVTSMMGQLVSFSPSPYHQYFTPQSVQVPHILEPEASASSAEYAFDPPANISALPSGVQIHPFIHSAITSAEAKKEDIARSRSADGVVPARDCGNNLVPKLDSQQAQTPKTVKRSSSLHNVRNASASATAPSNKMLSPSAPVFTPDTGTFRVPVYSQQTQFTIEQLITRIDRLQLKQEEDRQLLYNCVQRQTQDRKEILELKRLLEDRDRALGRTHLRDFSSGEIGQGWYNQI